MVTLHCSFGNMNRWIEFVWWRIFGQIVQKHFCRFIRLASLHFKMNEHSVDVSCNHTSVCKIYEQEPWYLCVCVFFFFYCFNNLYKQNKKKCREISIRISACAFGVLNSHNFHDDRSTSCRYTLKYKIDANKSDAQINRINFFSL